MAREAKVRVIVDVEDAKRSMDDVNQRIEKSRALGANLASNVQNIARGAAAGLAVVGGIADRAAGGGLLSTLAGNAMDTSASGWRRLIELMGGDPQAMSDSVARNRAYDRAVETVSEMVSGGGTISEPELKRMILEFDSMFQAGESNRQKAMLVGQDVRADVVGKEISDQFDQAVKLFEAAVSKLGAMLGLGG